jgi:hypothetical protein
VTEPQRLEALSPPEQGRGGPTHKYLQGLIREWAHTNGFKAEIEKELRGGGRVDVLLSRANVRIACEIAGTTTVEQELANLRKCLDAGCEHVCAVSLDGALLRNLGRVTADAFSAEEQPRIRLLSPVELLSFLASYVTEPESRRVAGYEVVTRQRNDEGEIDRRRKIADVMMKSIRRMREKT